MAIGKDGGVETREKGTDQGLDMGIVQRFWGSIGRGGVGGVEGGEIEGGFERASDLDMVMVRGNLKSGGGAVEGFKR